MCEEGGGSDRAGDADLTGRRVYRSDVLGDVLRGRRLSKDI